MICPAMSLKQPPDTAPDTVRIKGNPFASFPVMK